MTVAQDHWGVLCGPTKIRVYHGSTCSDIGTPEQARWLAERLLHAANQLEQRQVKK